MLPAKWPKWTLIVIAMALGAFSIAIALLLEPVAQAVSPELTPTPTVYHIQYGKQISEGCEDCHFDKSALQASAEPGTDLEAVWIEPESLAMVHGRLGCVTCHAGDGTTDAKDAAHEGLIADLSAVRPMDCVVCHTDLPEVIPGDRLKTPHRIVLDKVEHGESDLPCSDCHGGVGHGFDPVSGEVICSMTVCSDCHEELNLAIQMTDCEGCHIGPHDVSEGLACDDCHASLETWSDIEASIHPELVSHGKHTELGCFECHTWPNFEDINGQSDCIDCHAQGHEKPADTDCAKCHEIGVDWRLTDAAAIDHTEFWAYHQGAHALVDCQGCHLEGRYLGAMDPDCANCHALNQDTCDPNKPCVDCHVSDRSWSEIGQ